MHPTAQNTRYPFGCAIMQKRPSGFPDSTRSPHCGNPESWENCELTPDRLRNIVPSSEHLGYSEINKEIGF